LPELHEVAKAVECFVEQAGESVANDKEYLIMLTSKALSSVGKPVAAKRLFLLGTGLVTMSEWEVSGDQTTWTLDLKQVLVKDEPQLELVFFRALRTILEAMADVWDEPSGNGVLGLRHVCSVAGGVLGSPAKKRSVERLAAEIKASCEDTLESIREKRGWRYVPSVMNVDL
jgi:hypothetical protein